MKYFKRLKSKDIYLSPVNPDDYLIYTEWLNDPEVLENLLLDTRLITINNEKEALQRLSSDGYNFSIVLNETDELIGICSFDNTDFINRKAEVGIFIGNKECWNKGYGTEALTLLLDYGFSKLNLNNIMLTVFSFNKRAIKCYEKVGFKVFGKRSESKIVNEKKYDEIYMEILRKDYENAKS